MSNGLMRVVIIWLLLVRPGASRKDRAVTTCDAPAAVRGKPANITCDFHADMSRTRKPFGIDKYTLTGNPKVVLRCSWLHTTSPTPECSLPEGYSYDLVALRRLTLQILSATQDHVGTYVCREMFSDQQHIAQCSFTLQHTSPDHLMTTNTVTQRNTDITFSLNTGSSIISDKPERKTETIIRPVTEGEANTNLAVHISTVRSGSATSVVVITTVKNDSPNNSLPFLYGLDFMVVASVGIIAVTAAVTAITISIARMRKGRRDDRYRRSYEAPLPLEDLLPDHQNPGEDETSQETNFYWDIRDEPPTPSPELPRPCLWPALPGDYLHPAASDGIKEGTDGAKNVTPLYENSTLRNNSKPEHAGVCSPVTHLADVSHPKSSDIAFTCSATCSAETTRHHDHGVEAADQTEELESGYMPMTGTVRSIPPVAASQASREVAAAARISIPLRENNSAELPRSCLLPALPEDCLLPSVSRDVVEGTDDASKATPLYENSLLHHVDALGQEINAEHTPPSPAMEGAINFKNRSPSGEDKPTNGPFVESSDNRGLCSAETPTFQMVVRGQLDADESGYMPMSGTVPNMTAETSER